MHAKKARPYVKLSEIEDTGRSPATFSRAAAATPNGTLKATPSPSSMAAVPLRLKTEPHTQAGEWDLLIAHPPCTYMSKAGARWMYPRAGQLDEGRLEKALEAKAFFYKFLTAKCPRIAVENPQPLKVVGLPDPDCVVQPFHHGDPYSKKTLLWLKNLPPLTPTRVLTEYTVFLPSNTSGFRKGQKHSRGVAKNAKEASKTFPGIAAAMAEQWGILPTE